MKLRRKYWHYNFLYERVKGSKIAFGMQCDIYVTCSDFLKPFSKFSSLRIPNIPIENPGWFLVAVELKVLALKYSTFNFRKKTSPIKYALTL
jgi:hypothetical protein